MVYSASICKGKYTGKYIQCWPLAGGTYFSILKIQSPKTSYVLNLWARSVNFISFECDRLRIWGKRQRWLKQRFGAAGMTELFCHKKAKIVQKWRNSTGNEVLRAYVCSKNDRLNHSGAHEYRKRTRFIFVYNVCQNVPIVMEFELNVSQHILDV